MIKANNKKIGAIQELKDLINKHIDTNYSLFNRFEVEKLFLHRDCLLKILREKLG